MPGTISTATSPPDTASAINRSMVSARNPVRCAMVAGRVRKAASTCSHAIQALKPASVVEARTTGRA
jgi:hypothetical protein